MGISFEVFSYGEDIVKKTLEKYKNRSNVVFILGSLKLEKAFKVHYYDFFQFEDNLITTMELFKEKIFNNNLPIL